MQLIAFDQIASRVNKDIRIGAFTVVSASLNHAAILVWPLTKTVVVLVSRYYASGKDRYRSPGIHTTLLQLSPFPLLPDSERSWLIREHVLLYDPPACTMPFSPSGSLNRPSPLRLVVEPIAKRSGTRSPRTAVQSYWTIWFSRAVCVSREAVVAGLVVLMQGLRLTPYSCSDIDDLSLLGLWCLGLSNGAVGYWHWVWCWALSTRVRQLREWPLVRTCHGLVP
ncbi:Poly [ADP-ribose] polymerase [Fusarium oxysporum f. sp. albedinis]|nr:Poly [ADP-ribose] polymerase [Fusarium oxysporum f. sp. albedinis]